METYPYYQKSQRVAEIDCRGKFDNAQDNRLNEYAPWIAPTLEQLLKQLLLAETEWLTVIGW